MTASTCSACKRRRTTYSISRSGGGTYRRGNRSYRSPVCAECAMDLLPYASTHAGATQGGYDVPGLAHVVAQVAHPESPEHRPEAADVLTAHLARLTEAAEQRPYLTNRIDRLRDTAGLSTPEEPR